jgi:hypothetical protein
MRQGAPRNVLQGLSSAYVLIFNAGRQDEGVYTLQARVSQARANVLAFELDDDSWAASVAFLISCSCRRFHRFSFSSLHFTVCVSCAMFHACRSEMQCAISVMFDVICDL